MGDSMSRTCNEFWLDLTSYYPLAPPQGAWPSGPSDELKAYRVEAG